MSIETTIDLTGQATLIKRTREVVLFTPYKEDYTINVQREDVTEKDGITISQKDSLSIRKRMSQIMTESVDLSPNKLVYKSEILAAIGTIDDNAVFTTSTNKEINKSELLEIIDNMISGDCVINTPTTISVGIVAAAISAFGDKWSSE